MNQPAGLGSLKYSLAPPNAASTAWMRSASVHVKAGVVLVFMSFQRSCNMFPIKLSTRTFVSMKSRSWIVQTVGVAIANATYAAARRIARFAAPLARNAFPTLDMYRPS